MEWLRLFIGHWGDRQTLLRWERSQREKFWTGRLELKMMSKGNIISFFLLAVSFSPAFFRIHTHTHQKKRKFSHHLLGLMSFQTCTTFFIFLWNTKEYKMSPYCFCPYNVVLTPVSSYVFCWRRKVSSRQLLTEPLYCRLTLLSFEVES